MCAHASLNRCAYLLGLDGGILLGQGQLNVAWGGHVGVDATVRPVGAAALPHGPVALNVRDHEVVGVQALDLRSKIVESTRMLARLAVP